MKIVQVITTLSPGGAENHVLSLARGQVAAGHEMRILYLKGDGCLAPRFLKAGCVSVTKIPFERPGQILTAIYSLTRHFRSAGAEIVHTHCLKANALGGIAARLAGGNPAVVATKHNDEHHLHHPVVGWLHGLLSRLCDDHVIAVSDHVANFVHVNGHIPRRKITRIYNGFDRELYGDGRPTDVRREFDLPTDSVVFGIVGRVTKQKNHLFLLRAFAELVPRYPRARLLIVGGVGYTGVYYEQVKQEIGRLGIGGQVLMTGWRADAFNIIGGLDCMTMPSAWEGLGMAFLEALSQGIPVIATRVSAIPEVIRDGVDGLLVEPGDVSALIAAMEEMIRHQSDFAARVRTSGPSYVEGKFALSKMLAETFRVYQAVSVVRAG